MNNHLINGVEVIVERDSNIDLFLKETKYCDFSNSEIKRLAFNITKNIKVLRLEVGFSSQKLDKVLQMRM